MHDPNFLFHISSIFRVFASHPCQTHIRYFFFSFLITLLLLDLTYTLKCLYMREFSHVIYFDQSQISKQRETWKENSPKDQIPTSLYTIETEKMFLHLFYLDENTNTCCFFSLRVLTFPVKGGVVFFLCIILINIEVMFLHSISDFLYQKLEKYSLLYKPLLSYRDNQKNQLKTGVGEIAFYWKDST